MQKIRRDNGRVDVLIAAGSRAHRAWTPSTTGGGGGNTTDIDHFELKSLELKAAADGD